MVTLPRKEDGMLPFVLKIEVYKMGTFKILTSNAISQDGSIILDAARNRKPSRNQEDKII